MGGNQVMRYHRRIMWLPYLNFSFGGLMSLVAVNQRVRRVIVQGLRISECLLESSASLLARNMEPWGLQKEQ